MINSGSEVNAIILVYAAMLDLKVCFTVVEAQRIESYLFKTFGMVIANFQIKDKLGKD